MRRHYKLLKQGLTGDAVGATSSTPTGAIPVYNAGTGAIVLTAVSDLVSAAQVTLENGLLKTNTYDGAARNALDEIRLVLLQILEQLKQR